MLLKLQENRLALNHVTFSLTRGSWTLLFHTFGYPEKKMRRVIVRQKIEDEGIFIRPSRPNFEVNDVDV